MTCCYISDSDRKFKDTEQKKKKKNTQERFRLHDLERGRPAKHTIQNSNAINQWYKRANSSKFSIKCMLTRIET